MKQTTVTLHGGIEMPQIGFGTYMIDGNDATKDACLTALAAGYRHIDTAHAYQNESGVGQAIRESGIPRNEIWLTSKLWISDYTPGGKAGAEAAIDRMLKRLDTDYIDLLLIHQQFGDYMAAWQAMEESVHAGKVRTIGLSNFYGDRMEEVVANSEIKPSVFQLECHPYFQQKIQKKYMEQFGCVLEAWYPIGHGDKTLLNEPVFIELAEKYHKSPVQIILRWHIQEGTVVFPKSLNPEHIKSNIDIFDFTLTDDEIVKIRELDKEQSYYDFGKLPLEEQEKQLSMFVLSD